MLRLSDAIRKGCGMAPTQLFGKPIGYNAISGMGVVPVAACALGAARLATFGADGGGKGEQVCTFYPIYETYCICPANEAHCCYRYGPRATVGEIMIHLNDGLHWTRERIADWIETLEMGPAPAPEAVAELAQVEA